MSTPRLCAQQGYAGVVRGARVACGGVVRAIRGAGGAGVASALVGGLLLALAGLLFLAPPTPATLGTAPEDAVGANDRISAIVRAGDRIYLGGRFTALENKDGRSIARNRLAAVDANTGEVVADWNPNADGTVRAMALSPDGSRLYVAGSFTNVGGYGRKRLAAIHLATGKVDAAWSADASNTVGALDVSGGGVYAGGSFTSVEGKTRKRLAKLDLTTGALDPNWTPSADDTVRALKFSDDGSRLYVGGYFRSISGQARRFAALDPETGAVDGGFRPTPNDGNSIWSIAVYGGRVFVGTGDELEGIEAFDAVTGQRAWYLGGNGDVQAITVKDGTLYAGGHFSEMGGLTRRRLVAVDAATGTIDSQWTPNVSTEGSGVWGMASYGAHLYVGGDFRSISGEPHERFAQFPDGPDDNDSDTRAMTAAADAKIAEGAPDTNYGSASSLSVDGDTGGGKDDSALLRWDLSGIAPGTKVGSASVTLSVTNASAQTYEAYALKRAWAEPEATWNAYAAALPWEVAGAKGSFDRETTVAGTITPPATGEQSFALSPDLVQRWVDAPASNRGIIVADGAITDGMAFSSRESTAVDQRPRLTVTVEAASSTSEAGR